VDGEYRNHIARKVGQKQSHSSLHFAATSFSSPIICFKEGKLSFIRIFISFFDVLRCDFFNEFFSILLDDKQWICFFNEVCWKIVYYTLYYS